MGFNFRKSVKIMPGVKLNITKKGISSVSVGKNGARVNVGKKGTKTTVGIPGSGLSYSSYTPRNKKSLNTGSQQLSQERTSFSAVNLVIIGFVVLFILFIVFS